MAFCRSVWPAALVALLLLLGACDASFEPYAETDQTFSLFAYFDVSDERQRARVEVLQDEKPFSADTVTGTAVTLTRLATGRTVTLVNEPFSFQGLKHNFRTDQMDLRLDDTYRLAAKRAQDAEATTATFTTPHEVPQLTLEVPRLTLSEDDLRATVEGGTEDQLLYFGVDYYTVISTPPFCEPSDPLCRSCEKTFELQYAERARRTDTGYAATLDWEADIDSLWSGARSSVKLLKLDVQVGLVHPSTPTYEGLSYDALFRSSEIGPSNVERGVGFVVGASDDREVVRFEIPLPWTIVPLAEGN